MWRSAWLLGGRMHWRRGKAIDTARRLDALLWLGLAAASLAAVGATSVSLSTDDIVKAVVAVCTAVGAVAGWLGVKRKKKTPEPTDPTLKSLIEANGFLAKQLESNQREFERRIGLAENRAEHYRLEAETAWSKFTELSQAKTGAALLITEIAAKSAQQ